MWKKIKYYFFTLSFLAILIAPQVLYKITDAGKNSENSENRTLAEKPDFSVKEIEEYPARYEEYFNDHLPFKAKFIQLNQRINYHLFQMAENDQCVMGDDNWLFFKGDNTLEDFQGTCRYSEEQILFIADEIKRVNDYFNSLGKKFVLVIVPNKESIYGEYLPKKYTQFEDYTRADQVYEYLKENTDILVNSPKRELRENKDKYQSYYKYDTHWNAVGAYISVNSLLEQMNYQTMPPVQEVDIKENGKHNGDLADMLKLTDIFNDEPLLELGNISDINIETIYSIPHSIVYNKKFVSDSENQEKVYVVGDSFSAEYAEYLKYNFGECTVIHRDEYTPGLAESEEADVIVCEVVERYIIQMGNLSSIFIPDEYKGE